MQPTHVLFDFDGTLVDSAPVILRTFEQTLSEHGLQSCVPVNRSLIGPPLRQTLQLMSGSEDEQLLDAMAARFREIYDGPACATTPAYDGWDEVLLELCGAGLQLGIATNKRLLPTQQILQARGWIDHFDTVYAIDSCPGSHLDKAAMIAALLSEQGVAAETAIYIGDTEADAHAAAANAVEFWAVSWGYGKFSRNYPIFHSPSQIKKRLVRLPGMRLPGIEKE